jgi:xylan 1,4-beta-xylosidase
VELLFENVLGTAHVTIQRVNDDHGNVLKRYAAMGSPLDPTDVQVQQLNRETALPNPESTQLQGGKLSLTLTPNTLALVRVEQ